MNSSGPADWIDTHVLAHLQDRPGGQLGADRIVMFGPRPGGNGGFGLQRPAP